MNKDFVKEVMYIIIAILIGIVTIKFIIWLLPIILIGLCSYYIYKSIKNNKTKNKKQPAKKKNIKIIDMVEED